MIIVSLAGKPLYGLYYAIPFLPYRTLRNHMEGFPIGGDVLSILIVAVIIGALLHGKRLPKSKLYLVWLVFGVYLYLSMWYGAMLANAPLPIYFSQITVSTWKGYMLLPLVFVAAGLLVEDRKTVRNIILLAAFSVLAIDRSALMDSMSRSWSQFDESKRDGGPLDFAGSNGLAAFLTQSSMFFWGFGQFLKRRKAKLLCYGLVGLTLFATMYTFSRASYITLLVCTLMLGILKDRKLIFVVLIFLLTWQALVPIAVTERVHMTTDSSGQLDASAQGRVELWTNAKAVILSNPILGTGYASYQLNAHAEGLRDTHNWYVKVMIETGLIGMFFALALLQQLLSLAYRLFRHAQDPLYRGLGLGLLLMVSASIILNCFGDRWTFLEINGIFWVLAGASTRAIYLSQVVNSPEPTVEDSRDHVDQYLAYR
jgi:O-antigen ligase